MPRFSLFLTSALLLAAPAAAQEKIHSMTPQAVEKFIVAMTDKTKPGGKLSERQLIPYLNYHLFDAGKYASNVTFQIPGYDDQVRTIALGKPEFISNVLAGRQTMRNHQSSVSVHDIVIAANKQEATFRTVTSESGEMPLEEQYLPFTGQTECIQKIALDGAIPVILSADCESTLSFKE